jgi:diguanylate cyclase (GGDEF)-like protein
MTWPRLHPAIGNTASFSFYALTMSILAATILATESSQLHEAATVRLRAGDQAAPNSTIDDLLTALASLRAMIVERAREHADHLNPTELIELQSVMQATLDERFAHALNHWLAQHTQALTAEARRDALTGLLNRAAFEQQLQDEIARARRYERTLAVALFDVDRFKLINDRFGHPAGDAALRSVARVLESSLRQSDAVFRYGGDEFAALCPETSGPVMARVLERLEEKLRESVAEQRADLLSISWGVAAWPTDALEVNDLLRVADARLYICKQEHHRRAAAVGQRGMAR